MFPEEVLSEVERRCARLEHALEGLLIDLAQATTLAQVNIAAGIARDALIDD